MADWWCSPAHHHSSAFIPLSPTKTFDFVKFANTCLYLTGKHTSTVQCPIPSTCRKNPNQSTNCSKVFRIFRKQKFKRIFLMALPQCGGGSTVLHSHFLPDYWWRASSFLSWWDWLQCDSVSVFPSFVLHWGENLTIYLLPIDSFVLFFLPVAKHKTNGLCRIGQNTKGTGVPQQQNTSTTTIITTCTCNTHNTCNTQRNTQKVLRVWQVEQVLQILCYVWSPLKWKWSLQKVLHWLHSWQLRTTISTFIVALQWRATWESIRNSCFIFSVESGQLAAIKSCNMTAAANISFSPRRLSPSGVRD